MGKDARKKRAKFVDDGRVIAPMNVDGMPWYTQKKPPQEAGSEDAAGTDADDFIPEFMTRREKAAFTFGVAKAALLVTVVFVGGFFLFILFCIYVWFR